ncbi:TOBE domain-containing protein [Shewanella sp. C31]|nr:TOBE domain-containing protein [Shewanella electrica]
MGIRPEDREVLPPGHPEAFPAVVQVVEPLGPHQLVTLEAFGNPLKATLPPEPAWQPGEEVWLRAHPERLRFFDPATGRALKEVPHA